MTRGHHGTTQRRVCISPTQRRHARLARHDRTDAAHRKHIAMAGGEYGRYGRAHTPSTMIHDRPHQETRPNEQGEHASANASNAPPLSQARRRAALRDRRPRRYERQQGKDDKRREENNSHHTHIRDPARPRRPERQTARPTRVRVRAARALEVAVAIRRTERRAGEQASKEKTRGLAADREHDDNDLPARSHLM